VIVEGLKNGDLRATILKYIGIDKYEAKTGDDQQVIVVSFSAIDQRSASDLYSFLNGTFIKFRNVDISTNPNLDNHFLVFVELDRSPDFFIMLSKTIKEVSRVAGRQNWLVQVKGSDKDYKLKDRSWRQMIVTNPKEYEVSPQDSNIPNEPERSETGSVDDSERVMEFFKNSDLHECIYDSKTLILGGRGGRVKLKVLGFGNSDEIMKSQGIAESAIDQIFDLHLNRQLNTMLGEMQAQWVGGKIVIYDPRNQSTVMVAKPV
jgi:hypothetical protein